MLAAHERGDCVIATARSLEKIQDLPKSDKIRLMQLDVTEGFASLKTKLETAAAFFGRIDVVVNNAGGGMPCILEEGGCVVTSARRPVLNLKGCETDPTQSEKCST